MNASDVATLLDDNPESGTFRIDRRAFEDPEVFELEMQHVFEANWVFLGHASQAPKPNDYFTTWLGRAPVVVMRDMEGRLNAFINSCPHKRATLFHSASGNARVKVCRYHGWAFDSSGRNKLVKAREAGAYAEAFNQADHNLQAVAGFGNYRGMLFGTLNPNAMSLEEYLGDARTMLDLMIDQSPDGIELVPGVVKYTFEGNWKFQLENCSDGYHFTSTHSSFLGLVEQRSRNAKETGGVKTVWHNNRPWESSDSKLGTFSFENGHSLLWSSQVNLDTHPLIGRLQELQERVGSNRAKWMFTNRSATIFPNLQIAENAASQLRVMRPISAARTEMTTYCFGPVGESREARAQRIRQYEDFFNPSGLATPDDTVAYEDCQLGYSAPTLQRQLGYMRGGTVTSAEPNAHARELGIRPVASVEGAIELYDETLLRTSYRVWHRQLVEGAQRNAAANMGAQA
jgi:phenylpropionate dioxygenase-like ring-hydroxylating dioxygenase large terminal subunit